MVRSTFTFSIFSGAMEKRSSDRTATSANMPGAISPISFSRNMANALLTHGKHPPSLTWSVQDPRGAQHLIDDQPDHAGGTDDQWFRQAAPTNENDHGHRGDQQLRQG